MNLNNKRRIKFYEEQYWYAKNVISKYFNRADYKNTRVLEIGSAEGGAINYFAELGADSAGIEISEGRNEFAKNYIKNNKINFICGDICDDNLVDSLGQFDFIIIRDVIEHIPDKKKALENLSKIIKNEGLIFLSFPPKYSPYAGHQQNVKKIPGKLPFIHLLPKKIYSFLLKLSGLNKSRVQDLMFTKSLMISIFEIEKVMKEAKIKIVKKDYYFIRPCFEKRFGLKPRKNALSYLPIIKEVFTLGSLYILKKGA